MKLTTKVTIRRINVPCEDDCVIDFFHFICQPTMQEVNEVSSHKAEPPRSSFGNLKPVVAGMAEIFVHKTRA